MAVPLGRVPVEQVRCMHRSLSRARAHTPLARPPQGGRRGRRGGRARPRRAAHRTPAVSARGRGQRVARTRLPLQLGRAAPLRSAERGRDAGECAAARRVRTRAGGSPRPVEGGAAVGYHPQRRQRRVRRAAARHWSTAQPHGRRGTHCVPSRRNRRRHPKGAHARVVPRSTPTTCHVLLTAARRAQKAGGRSGRLA